MVGLSYLSVIYLLYTISNTTESDSIVIDQSIVRNNCLILLFFICILVDKKTMSFPVLRQGSVFTNGEENRTDLTCQTFSDQHMVMITQTGKVGTLIQVLYMQH